MKKRNLITLILLLTAAFTYGQKLAPNTTVKAKKSTFKIEEIKRGSITSNNMLIRNTANIYYNRKTNISANDIALYEKINKGSMLKTFRQVFSIERLRQLTSERILNLTLYVMPTGKVEGVDFLIPKNTSLTASELEALEAEIKNNISFKINPDQTKGGEFFILPIAVKYQNVLDGIER